MTAQRALILGCLSRMTDATTSPERQEQDCRRYCEANGMTVAGVASDTDVSGSIDRLDRPALGPWLKDRTSEFDVVVASKLDRVGRNARHIHALTNYQSDLGKSLRWLDNYVDTSTPMGRMIVFVMATVAEMELDEIKSRNKGAAQHNIQAGKYRGGLPPMGYMAVKDGAGDWRHPTKTVRLPSYVRLLRGFRTGNVSRGSWLTSTSGRFPPIRTDRPSSTAVSVSLDRGPSPTSNA